MRKINFLFLFLTFILGCKQSNSKDVSNSYNTPSIRDPKAFHSPDEIYGALFDSVQMKGIYPDSKTFVDCTPNMSSDSILAIYETERKKPDFNLQYFVNQYFTLPKQHLSNYKPNTYESAEKHIEELLLALTHTPDTVVSGTLLPLPNPYVTKDGKATEVNYWDSYFTMLGLQAAGRTDMMENMVNNFAFLINTEGYVPYGNRTYFLSRSQPPFFACMVQLLAESKGDDVYKKYLSQLEKEYQFWMDGKPTEGERGASFKRHVVWMDGNTLNRYYDDKDKPRPEFYKEDMSAAKKSGQELKIVYRHIRASAESGWDFSSRWLGNGKDFSTIQTTDIAPIDLNALLYNLESVIMKGKILEKKLDEAAKYEKLASKRREALMRYCWSEDKQMFFDFDFQKYKKKEVYSLAAVFPLYFRMVTKREADKVAYAIEKMFLRPGGVVTTLNNTGQTWDSPYGFAPLQWMTIKALRNYGHYVLADEIKKRWVDLNLKVYKSSGRILDKYNVEDISLDSGGSNYSIQDGFGWTNGVLLKFLKEH